MNPVIPSQLHVGARLVMVAEHQNCYETLPASVSEDGVFMSEWELTDEEIGYLMAGGRIRIWQFTNGQLQPMQVEVTEPDDFDTIES